MRKTWLVFSLMLGVFGFSGALQATNVDPQGPVANEIKVGIISQRFHQQLDLKAVAKRLDNPANAAQLKGGFELISRMYNHNPTDITNLSNALLRASLVKYDRKEVNEGMLATAISGYRDVLNRTVLSGRTGVSNKDSFVFRGWLKHANIHVIHLVAAVVEYASSANINLTDMGPVNTAVPAPQAQQNAPVAAEKPSALDGLNQIRAIVPEVNAMMQNPDIEAAVLGIMGLFAKPKKEAAPLYAQPQPEAPMPAPQQALFGQPPQQDNTYANNPAGVSTVYDPGTGEALPHFVDEKTGEIYWYTPDYGHVFTIDSDGILRMIA